MCSIALPTHEPTSCVIQAFTPWDDLLVHNSGIKFFILYFSRADQCTPFCQVKLHSPVMFADHNPSVWSWYGGMVSTPVFSRCRRLCILKGIYPHEPKHRKKVEKGSTVIKTYYFRKDIQFLLHEPIVNKFRDFKVSIPDFKRVMSWSNVNALWE